MGALTTLNEPFKKSVKIITTGAGVSFGPLAIYMLNCLVHSDTRIVIQN
jgi:hypothetical protein